MYYSQTFKGLWLFDLLSDIIFLNQTTAYQSFADIIHFLHIIMNMKSDARVTLISLSFSVWGESKFLMDLNGNKFV